MKCRYACDHEDLSDYVLPDHGWNCRICGAFLSDQGYDGSYNVHETKVENEDDCECEQCKLLYAIKKSTRTDESINLMFTWVNSKLIAGLFNEVDEFVNLMFLYEKAPVSIMIGMLTITLAAKNKLPSRQHYVAYARSLLARERTAEQIESLMRGLE